MRLYNHCQIMRCIPGLLNVVLTLPPHPEESVQRVLVAEKTRLLVISVQWMKEMSTKHNMFKRQRHCKTRETNRVRLDFNSITDEELHPHFRPNPWLSVSSWSKFTKRYYSGNQCCISIIQLLPSWKYFYQFAYHQIHFHRTHSAPFQFKPVKNILIVRFIS